MKRWSRPCGGDEGSPVSDELLSTSVRIPRSYVSNVTNYWSHPLEYLISTSAFRNPAKQTYISVMVWSCHHHASVIHCFTLQDNWRTRAMNERVDRDCGHYWAGIVPAFLICVWG
jgi:hypothetical protein